MPCILGYDVAGTVDTVGPGVTGMAPGDGVYDGDRVRALAALLGQRTLRPVISHVLPLAAAAQAHRILESRDAGGKVVLDVASG